MVGGHAGVARCARAGRFAVGPSLRRRANSRPPPEQHRCGAGRPGSERGPAAGAASAYRQRGVLRVGGTGATGRRAIRLRGRQSAVHPLSDVQRRRAPPSLGAVLGTRRRVLGPVGFMGALPRRGGKPPAAERPHGIRRAGGHRARPLRGPALGVPGCPLQERLRRCGASQAVSEPLRGLLALVRGRFRGQHGRDRLRRRGRAPMPGCGAAPVHPHQRRRMARHLAPPQPRSAWATLRRSASATSAAPMASST